MVFVFPVGEQLLDAPSRVLSRKSHGRGVVVNSRTVELEDLDDSQSQPKEHVLMPRVIEPEKSLADLVVLDVVGLFRTESQFLRVQWLQPVLHLVKRIGGRENVVDQKREYFVIVELHAFIARHVGADNLANPHGLDKVFDDRVSSQHELGMDRILVSGRVESASCSLLSVSVTSLVA